MSRLTPEQIVQQHVSPMIDTDTGQIVAVAYSDSSDRIITRWKPGQADELEAVGLLMVKLAGRLRESREEVPQHDMDATLGQLDRTSRPRPSLPR